MRFANVSKGYATVIAGGKEIGTVEQVDCPRYGVFWIGYDNVHGVGAYGMESDRISRSDSSGATRQEAALGLCEALGVADA